MSAVLFNPAEIGGAGAALVSVARELEAYAMSADPTPSATLASRIAAAVAREPAPTPPVLFWRALQMHAVPAAFGYLVASFRVALGIGRMFPVAVRAQAIALVLTVALVLAGSGAVLAAGAATVLQVLAPAPAPHVPAVVETRATPSPRATPDREKPAKKPKDSRQNSGGAAGSSGRGGSGHDGEDRDDESDNDDDGHDGSGGSSGSSGARDDDNGGSSGDRSDGDRGSSSRHGDSADSDG